MGDLEIVALRRDRVRAAGDVLARAFYKDPLFTFLLPDEATRMPPLAWLMRACVSFGRLYGRVYTTMGMEAVTVCLTPHSPPANLWRLLRSGLAVAPLTRGRSRYDRVATPFRPLGATHSRDAPEPHWYVWFLGVEPSLKNRGFGGALLRHVLGLVDAEGMPCRLDTANVVNVPFYERRGFEVIGEGDFPGGGPHYWQMKRRFQL